MAKTPSTMRPLGSALPDFDLPNVSTGQRLKSSDLKSPILVVAFICNHCPFVIHLKNELAAFGRSCRGEGVDFVAISSNDAATYPVDGPEAMAVDAREFGYVFPYLYDETQEVARAFDAACTPDFFVYDQERKLAYRGQFDSSRPGNGVPITGVDLRAAVSALRAGKRPREEQKPSIGCNIKWKQA
jgi:thiol-disulfide isomerase/thioredoxin